MAETILVVGTTSHAGKSSVAAGLCRVGARRGYAIAPFKAQNMSNNARAVPSPDGGWGEIGISQYVQARAAGVTPTTDMNPVLLKPRGNGQSQIVLHGRAVGNYRAGDYYDQLWARARDAVVESYRRLGGQYDLLIAEGAGSPAEINLQNRDLANIEAARIADARILIVADIERGGAFASLYGTIELLPEEVRSRVVGAVINKFRGDRDLLEPGIEEIEDLTGVPVLGVVPYEDIGLPSEDSVSLPGAGEEMTWGDEDGVGEDESIVIAVPRLPRISNFTDLEPLAREPGVRVHFTGPEADPGFADAVIIPGTKNTVDDLLALRDSGFIDHLKDFRGYVVGICGGYQMLGERILNPGIESAAEDVEEVEGAGLLPVETEFSRDKHVESVVRELDGHGPLAGARGTVRGYEIHMGRSRTGKGVSHPLGPHSAATDRVLGTYLHGIFENEVARDGFLDNLFSLAGKERPGSRGPERSPYDEVGDLIEDNVDVERLVDFDGINAE